MANTSKMIIENGVLKGFDADENDPNVYVGGTRGSIKVLKIPDTVHTIGSHALYNWYIEKIVFPENIAEISETAFEDSSLIDVYGPKDFFNKQDKSWFLNRFGAPESMYFNGVIDKNSPAWSYFADTIRRNKWGIFAKACSENNFEKLSLLLDVWKKVSLKDLDAYLDYCDEYGYADFTMYLMEYKNKHYPPEELDILEMDRIEKQMGTKEMSVSDWRNFFRFSIRKGTVKILQYIGDEDIVTIPEYIGKNKVIKIANKAFTYRNVKEVTLPASIEEIEPEAFAGCDNLTMNVIEGSPAYLFAKENGLNFAADAKPPVITGSNEENQKEKEVKDNSVTDWREVYGKIAIFDNTAILGKYKGSEELVVVPSEVGNNRVVEIEKRAFYKNTAIKKVVISEGIEIIGDNAFSGCNNLKEVVIPESIRIIEDKAFSGCKNLIRINIPGPIEELGDNVFKGCSALKTIEISEGAEYFDTEEFDGCKNITDIYLPASIDDPDEIQIEGLNSITIHAPAGSAAEIYARENKIPFVAV